MQDFLINTRLYGSVAGLLCLTYAMNVAIEVLRTQNTPVLAATRPRLVSSAVGSLYWMLSLPCIVWPAIYIGLFDGWLQAVGAWLLLQVFGGLLTLRLGIGGPLLSFHVIGGFIALATGYWLTFTHSPW